MRLVFSDVKTLLEWAKINVTEGRYDVYLTSDKEIIFLPLKSTRPIRISYLRLTATEDLTGINEVLKNENIHVFRIKSIEWDETRAVGIKIPLEE